MPIENTAFQAFAKEHLKSIEDALNAYTTFPGKENTKLTEAMRYSLLNPGKRIRPLLTLMAAKACGGKIEDALPAACAIEMVHVFSLIHDDLPAMDDDNMRRGKPACHKKFGDAIAILAGDALLSLAFEVLTTHVQPVETAAACCKELAVATGPTGMTGGQADDVDEEWTPQSAYDLEVLSHKKTGRLFIASLQLGALTGSATKEQHKALGEYGSRFGVAFQITDDLLDKEEGTFPHLLGIKESKIRAEDLIKEARHALTSFGKKAQPLQSLAQEILKRES